MIRTLKLFAYLVIASQLSTASDWKPIFDDKPVDEEQIAAIKKALPCTPIVEPKAERKVLVFSATAGFRHRSIPTGKLALEQLGAHTGAYVATVSDDPANFEADVLKEFDSVILLSPTQDFFMPNKKQRDQFSDAEWTALEARHKRLVDNLVEYVRDGGGLVGIHAATDSCYGHKEYGEMVGGYFWGHPWTAGMNVTIVVEDPEHEVIKPVFAGMNDFRIQDEIYQFKEKPYSRDKLRVLLNLDPERSDEPKSELRRKDNDYAVCWVQSVGKGRVFYSSLGHNHHIYSNPLMLKHYLAGIQFAMGDLEADTTPSAEVQIPNLND
ncbi:MAG TPA: ThuA domain-containing protein [Opitutae bacterium]|nr:ThuA domain-containing protein [Opitutae bacterium]